MRTPLTRQGVYLITGFLVALFVWAWMSGSRSEADVPSHREHRQGAILRDSDIESTIKQKMQFMTCEANAPRYHICVADR